MASHSLYGLTRPRRAGVERAPSAAAKRFHLKRRLHTATAVEGFSRDCLFRLADFPELPLQANTRDVVKAGNTALLVKAEFPVGRRMVTVAYKRVKRKTWWKVLKAAFSPNGTRRSWRVGHQLLERGIATAEPLAVIAPRWFAPHRPSYLATEWIHNGRNLAEFAAEVEDLSPPSRRRELTAAAEALGTLLGRMHAAGVSHRDLKAGNLLVTHSGGSLDVTVIDLDGAKVRNHVSPRTRWKNLARFALAAEQSTAVTPAARLRFLRAYMQQARDAKSWKLEWKRIGMWLTRLKKGRGIADRGVSLVTRRVSEGFDCSQPPESLADASGYE